jgi:thiol-disulfide isomerase/thioredoxin
MHQSPLRSFALRSVLALTAAAGLASAAMGADDIKREGEGARRQALNAMELKPFDMSLTSKITEWNTAPTGGDLSGKVVVFCMWADWYAPCKRVMVQCQKLAEKYGKDGLVVIAVHNAKGWDASKNPKSVAGVPFFAGVDASGEFRKSINSDQDPDVYVVDRAGQMRYADVDKASLEAGVQLLLKETSEQAGGINAAEAARRQKADAEQRRAEAINQNVDMTSLPELDFPAPSPDAYKKAKWPKMPADRTGKDLLNPGQSSGSSGEKKEEKVQSVTFNDAQWLANKPSLNGRVRLVYLWHPDSRFTHDNIGKFDLVQRQRGRDVAVVGAISAVYDGTHGESATSESEKKEVEMDPVKVKKRFEAFLTSRHIGHGIYFDAGASIMSTGLDKENAGSSSNSDLYPNPFVCIVSSDGVLRWAGGTWFPSYEAALEQVIREDPGVQARRKVEAAFIKAKQGK